MSAALSFRLCNFDDGVRRAYARLFPDDPDKGPVTLRWRFLDNPHGEAKFAVASDADEIVGMIALVPTRLLTATREIMAYQAIDTVVDPAYRGHGVFVRLGTLAQDAERLGSDIIWGLPNANAAPGWYGRLGWTNFGVVPMLIRPLRTGFIFRRVHRSLGALDVPLVGKSRQDVDSVLEWTGFDALWAAAAPAMGTTIDRSAEWMRWRLADRPGAAYRAVGSRSGDQLDAVVVTRTSDKHGARLCYVMDSISRPEKGDDLARMLSSELAGAADGGAEAALAWCAPHAPNYAAYRKAGFMPFPQRLRPIEINFGARPLVSESEPAVKAPWTISLLDSDTN